MGKFPHKLTTKERKKGGQSKSPLKAFQNQLRHIRRCSSRCRIYPCFFASSIFNEGKECLLKKQPTNIQKRLITSLFSGEIGFNSLILETVLQLSAKIDEHPTVRNLIAYLNSLTKVKEAIFVKTTIVKEISSGSAINDMLTERLREAQKIELDKHAIETLKRRERIRKRRIEIKEKIENHDYDGCIGT